jgi:enoyl-CoA hydratase
VINVEDRDGVTVVTLEHGKVNALDLELLQAITTTVNGLADARAVVLTGAGRAFSAGVDLRRLVEGGASHVREFLPALSEALLAVFDFPRPLVAAVNGHAIAGGAILAFAADLRVMAAGTIGLTEVLVGVTFPAAPLGIAEHVAGPHTGLLTLTGQTFPPSEALRLGLVDEVATADALLGTAIARAAALAQIDADAYALTKAEVRRAAHARIADGARRDPDVVERWASAEVLGGMADYLASLAR